MPTIGYANLPVPAGGNSPTVPGDIAALATAIDPRLRQSATDLADRTTKYAAAAAGLLVTADDGTMWLKISASDVWVTIWEPVMDWQPLSLASGFEAGQTDPEYRIDRGQVHLRGRITRTDTTDIATAGVKLGEVPEEAIPAQIASWAGGASLGGDPVTGVGRCEVFSPDQDGNALGDAGSIIWYSQDGSGVDWVDLSGSYWLD